MSNLKERSKEWWENIKNNKEKFEEWLRKQYDGETSAYSKILNLRDTYYPGITKKQFDTLTVIAEQEAKHANWIKELLLSRNLDVNEQAATNRYWSETLKGINSFESGCAVGAHAEAMRLARIEVICEDEDAPSDVREVFKNILKEELFHEKAFRKMAGSDAMEVTQYSHELGLALLGLEP